MPDKVSNSIYMDEQLSDKLKILSSRENRSLNSYINIVLKDHTDRKLPKPKLVKKVTLKRRSC